MEQGDKELILRLADLYCRMANTPEGTPTSFTNILKAGIDLDALMETLDLTPLSEDKVAKIDGLGKQIITFVRNDQFESAKQTLTDLINFVSENVPVEQLAPEFSAFMGAPMTREVEAISQTSRDMMQALNKTDPTPDEMSAIRRGADVLQGLILDGKIAGGFAGLMEGMPEPEMA